MRLRAIHLACMLLLLSSLSAAEGATLRSGEFGLGGHYIAALLAQDRVASRMETPRRRSERGNAILNLDPGALARQRAAHTMRAPAANSLDVQAVTGSGL